MVDVVRLREIAEDFSIKSDVCLAQDCDRASFVRNLCQKHYYHQIKVFGVVKRPLIEAAPRYQKPKITECIYCGDKVRLRGLCDRHYFQWLRRDTNNAIIGEGKTVARYRSKVRKREVAPLVKKPIKSSSEFDKLKTILEELDGETR